ncbi:MAG: hypothetical protein ACUVQ8_04920 [Nitrososphaeria archaeon]
MSEVPIESSPKRNLATKRNMAIILLIIGLIFLMIPFVFSINTFLNYKEIAKPIDESISGALISVSFDLIDLVAKLAFLGICVWIGAIVLKNGIDLFRDKSDTK